VPLNATSRARMTQVWEEVKAKVDNPSSGIRACSALDFSGIPAASQEPAGVGR
jgi:hypothetical protein